MDLSPLALKFLDTLANHLNTEKSSGDQLYPCLTPISDVKISETLLA